VVTELQIINPKFKWPSILEVSLYRRKPISLFVNTVLSSYHLLNLSIESCLVAQLGMKTEEAHVITNNTITIGFVIV